MPWRRSIPPHSVELSPISTCHSSNGETRSFARHLPDHLFEHFLTMARLHADNRYDRFTPDVEAITGRPATSVRDFVAQHGELFGRKNLPTKESERV